MKRKYLYYKEVVSNQEEMDNFNLKWNGVDVPPEPIFIKKEFEIILDDESEDFVWQIEMIKNYDPDYRVEELI